MQWKPNVVVAAIIEREGDFLIVEETTEDGRVVINQPAGHLERNETLFEAVQREVLEETAWRFRPEGIVGLYLLPQPDSAITYLRVCFLGRCHDHDPQRPLDHEITRAAWMSHEALLATRDRHRSPLVLQCVNDYLAGRHYPLDLIRYVQP
ncbi:MAG: NUDIX hydrolase [Chromatiales bacterium]